MGSAIILNNRIELSCEYDLEVINRIRQIDGRKWNEPKHPGVWNVPVTAWHADMVCRLLPEFYIDPTIKFMAEGEKAKQPKIQLPKELYKFQVEGIKYMASVKGRCILADDMGLGKSAQALCFVRAFTHGKTLIVSPANVTFKWAQEECSRWIPDASVEVLRTSKDPIPDVDILVMSYAIMVLKYDELKSIPFQTVVYDEAHALKSFKSQRSRIAKALAHAGIPHILLLSGTPFMNNPGELFSLLNIIDPVGFSNYFHYATRYCGAFQVDGMWIFPKDIVSNREELEGRLKHYMIRRTKQEVELQLPELTRTYMPIDLSNKSEYTKAVMEFKDWRNASKSHANALVKLTALRQVIGREKVEAVVELAETILEAGRKVVILARHKEVVTMLASKLKKHGVGIISGDVKAEERQKQASNFLLDKGRIRVMIISEAGTEGINLYAASDIIFAERLWNPAREEQAEARLHRIGQRQNVSAYYPVVMGTIDQKMDDLIRTKREVIGQVISQDEIVSYVIENI